MLKTSTTVSTVTKIPNKHYFMALNIMVKSLTWASRCVRIIPYGQTGLQPVAHI